MNDSQVEQASQPEGLFMSSYGIQPRTGWRSYDSGRQVDRVFDMANWCNPQFHKVSRRAKRTPVQRVHIVSVDVPARRHDLEGVLNALRDTHHDVTVSLAPLGDRGKFQNINLALRDVDLSEIDWLIVVDDDIAFPGNFLDRFLYVCEAASLRIAQPAHRFRSHASWQVTQRMMGSLAHLTHFVECGPLTAFHRSVFDRVLPFVETRWAWGLDVLWGEIARRDGFRIGIVDATPIAHLRPVAQTYDFGAAATEAQQLLERLGVRRTHEEIFRTTEVLKRLD